MSCCPASSCRTKPIDPSANEPNAQRSACGAALQSGASRTTALPCASNTNGTTTQASGFAYGNENWEFAPNGLMAKRYASINDLRIAETERTQRWERKA